MILLFYICICALDVNFFFGQNTLWGLKIPAFFLHLRILFFCIKVGIYVYSNAKYQNKNSMIFSPIQYYVCVGFFLHLGEVYGYAECTYAWKLSKYHQ